MIEQPFSIRKMDKSEASIILISDFIRSFEFLLPDPYSKKVDITDYSRKLNTLGECWCLEKNNEMVGFIGGYINDIVAKKAYIQLILVSDKYQNLHGGEALMRSFLAFAQGKDFKEVQLTVDLCNEKAKSFYRKLGFEKSREEHPNHLKQFMILSM